MHTAVSGAVAFFAAAECGDAKRVDELLAQIPRADRSKKDYRKRTALHLAVERGHDDVAALLIGKIDLAATDCAGFTALHLAAELGHSKIVARLLKENPWLCEIQAFNNLTCLHLATIKGHLAIVKQLLAINLNIINVKGGSNPAFDFAIEYSHEEIDPKGEDRTALDFAVEYGHQEIVSLLVEAVLATNDDDLYKDMFHNAVIRGYELIVSQLFARRPDLIDAEDDQGKTALQLAAENGYHSIVHQLFAFNPGLTEVGGTYKMSLLHFAAEYGYDTVVARLLVEKPHLIDGKDERGATVLHVAALGGHEKVVAQLLAVKPALVSATDVNRETPLHYAAKKGHVQCVAPLLAPNPELINAANTIGETPFELAVDVCHHRVVACLLSHGATCRASDLFWQVFYDAKDETSDEVLMLMLGRHPELVRLEDHCETGLHLVFERRRESEHGEHFSEELMLRCWQLYPEALHVADSEKNTPFEVAISNDNEFAIELVQGKLSFDEIVNSYAKCWRVCPQSILGQLGECLAHSLNNDVIKVVYDYFLGEPKKNKRKRDGDGDSESEDKTWEDDCCW